MKIINILKRHDINDCRSCDCGNASVDIDVELYVCDGCTDSNIFCRIKYKKTACIRFKIDDEIIDELLEIDNLDDWKNKIKEYLPIYYSDVIAEIINKLNEK